MDLLIGMLIFLPFITIIISLHELAHLTTARKFGMKIREYFVGFGPQDLVDAGAVKPSTASNGCCWAAT